MPQNTDPNRGICSTATLEDVRFPEEVADGFATLLDREESVSTAAEWVTALRVARSETADRPPSETDLCTVDDGRHAFVDVDDVTGFACVLDPLVVPFLRGQPGTIRSVTPVRGTTVEIEVAPDGVTCSHPGAVASIGVADDGARSETVTPERMYRQVCGYVNAFEDASEYDAWAATVDAATTAVPVETGVEVARKLAEHLFDASDVDRR